MYNNYNYRMRLFLSLSIILLLNISVLAKDKSTNFDYNKYISNIPIYPNSAIYDLNEKRIRMRIHLTEDSFEKVSEFYMKKMLEKGWKIEFPNDIEYKIWMEALNKDRTKTKNIMIGLVDPKTNINCNLSIGVAKDARLVKNVTIVSIYLTDTMLR